MRSVVSFRFDGEHSKEPMEAILKSRFKHCKNKIRRINT